MKMTTKILALLMGTALMVGAGCGSGDTPTTLENELTQTGRLNGQVEKIEWTTISIRVLQDGKLQRGDAVAIVTRQE